MLCCRYNCWKCVYEIFAFLLIIKPETNIVKGTLSVISSDPPYTDGSTRFPTVP